MTGRMILAVGLVAVVAVLGIAEPASAQGVVSSSFQNWNFLGGGARARGMGGAYLGISDDIYAGSWNPAGLVYNEGVMMGFNFTLSRVNLGLDNAIAGKPLADASESSDFSNLASASFVAPFTVIEHEVILSAYYNRIQNIYTRGDFRADLDTALGAPFGAQYSTAGNMAVAGGAFGTVIAKGLTLGGSLGLVTGDGAESYSLDIDSTRRGDAYFQDVRFREKADLDFKGLTVALGTLYRSQRWSAGAVFSPGWTLTQSVDFTAYSVSTHNQVPYPSETVLAPLKGTKVEVDIPWTLGLGGAYHLTDNVLVALDYQYRGFGASTYKAGDSTSGYRLQSEPAEPGTDMVSQRVEWKSLHQIRLGAEYRRQTGWGVVPLRVGFRNEPLVIGGDATTAVLFEQRLDGATTAEFPYFLPISTTSSAGGQVMGWTVTLGSGIHWSQVRLDLSVEWTGFSYDEVGSLGLMQRCQNCREDDPNVEVTDKWGKRILIEWGDFVRSYDNSQVRMMLNFTGYF